MQDSKLVEQSLYGRPGVVPAGVSRGAARAALRTSADVPAGDPPVRALGNTDEVCFHPVLDGIPDGPKSGMERRYRLQRLAADLLPGERVGRCGLHAIKNGRASVTRNRDGQHGITNVRRCGSGWVCPVCAPKIAAGRVDEIDQGIEAWHSRGGDLILAALTVQHHAGNDLRELRDVLAKAQRAMWSGRWAGTFYETWGVVGQIRNTEVTWGAENGWHPHSHVLLFTRALSPEEEFQMVNQLKVRWVSVVGRFGWQASYKHGLNASRVARYEEKVAYAEELLADRRRVAEYFGKGAALPTAEELVSAGWGPGQELTMAHLKTAKGQRFTPWMLLMAAGSEDGERAPALFQEYADAMKGAVMVRWSKGLRELLGLNAEHSDEELAEAEEEETQVVAEIPIRQWRQLVLQGRAVEMLGELDQAQLDPEQVQGWLNAYIGRCLRTEVSG